MKLLLTLAAAVLCSGCAGIGSPAVAPVSYVGAGADDAVLGLSATWPIGAKRAQEVPSHRYTMGRHGWDVLDTTLVVLGIAAAVAIYQSEHGDEGCKEFPDQAEYHPVTGELIKFQQGKSCPR